MIKYLAIIAVEDGSFYLQEHMAMNQHEKCIKSRITHDSVALKVMSFK